MGAVATHMIDLSDGSLKTVPDLQLGDPGVDGKTILNGSGAPAGGTGVDGDFYIDTTANEIYGPKTGGAWGSATSLVGPTGAAGADGADGADGAATWTISSVTTGAAGSSVIITNVGTSSNVDLEITIPRGSDGNSAYELAVSQGYGGSLTDWLTSLQGTDGNDGDSAYDVAVGQGFVGTVTAWLDSLVGDTGPVGPTGPAGDMTSSDIDTLAKLNAIVTDATIVDQSHTHAATAISDSTPAGRTLLTAADAAAQRTALNVEDGATADQSDAEIETAYNNQVAVVSQAAAEAGTATIAERWTPQRVAQAIDALALKAADIDTLAELNAILTDATLGDTTAAGRALMAAADAAAQRTLLNVQDGATADQSDAEIETAYNNQVAIVSQVDAEAGTSTTAERWTPQRVKQAIDALALKAADIDTLAKLNAILTDATLIDTADSRLSDSRTPTAHTHPASELSDSTAAGRAMITAADAAAQRTALNVEDGATADQSDAEIETAYNNQVAIVSQVDAEAGTSTTAERWTPQRVKQSIDALAPAAVEQGLNTETDGATITFDLNDSHKQTVELAGNRTLALANVSVGDVFMIRLEQDSVGSRTVTWWSTINWAGGTAPTLTTTADKTDVFIFVCTASNVYDGFIVGQNI